MDWAGCSETRKSTSAQLFKLGDCAVSAVSWRSRKQFIFALSSTEAEYVTLCDAAQEAVVLRGLLGNIGFIQNAPTTIFKDNQGAICLSQNPKDQTRTKHIDIKYQYIRERVAAKQLVVQHSAARDMIARDIMTEKQFGIEIQDLELEGELGLKL